MVGFRSRNDPSRSVLRRGRLEKVEFWWLCEKTPGGGSQSGTFPAKEPDGSRRDGRHEDCSPLRNVIIESRRQGDSRKACEREMVDGWGSDGIDGGGEEKGREKRKRTDEVVGERRFGFSGSLWLP